MARIGDDRVVHRLLVGKPEGKRPLGGARRRRDGWVSGTCGYGEELWGSINEGNFLTSGKVYRLASQESLCSSSK
jgi:hypothetical protein